MMVLGTLLVSTVLTYAANQAIHQDNPAEQLPVYSEVSVSPASATTLQSLREVIITLSDNEYDPAIGIMPYAQSVTAYRIQGEQRTALDVQIKPTIRNAQLLLTITPALADTMQVELIIPRGLTNNLPMPVANMTAEQMQAEGGCTNPELTLQYTIEPGFIDIIGVTNQAFTPLPDAILKANLGELLEDGDIVSHIFVQYEHKLHSAVRSRDFANYVTIQCVETGQYLSLNAYSCGLSVLVFDEDSYRNVRDSSYIDIFFASDDYINAEMHIGTYEVTILPGIGRDINGQRTAGTSFSFEYRRQDDITDIAQPMTSATAQPTKQLRNGQLVICRDQHVYNAHGARIQ